MNLRLKVKGRQARKSWVFKCSSILQIKRIKTKTESANEFKHELKKHFEEVKEPSLRSHN